MFRNMRRFRQQIPDDESIEILTRSTSGVLSLCGDDGYPYGVPMSFLYKDGHIYFHCAKSGHKLDALRSCDKASFCVISEDNIIPEKYTTYFKSVIAFGRIREITDGGEKRGICSEIAGKYRPGYEDERRAEIDKEFAGLCILDMTVEHLTGKEATELSARRRNG